ncbi:hypothetical protein ACFYPC_32570 [Streptomyces sp. NPDC005808]|uniref:hypothetical protein n=1 Tax=Streptomyces sp. NPDC005808 TaxID=3364734 RepID=UPI0036A68BE8
MAEAGVAGVVAALIPAGGATGVVAGAEATVPVVFTGAAGSTDVVGAAAVAGAGARAAAEGVAGSVGAADVVAAVGVVASSAAGVPEVPLPEPVPVSAAVPVPVSAPLPAPVSAAGFSGVRRPAAVLPIGGVSEVVVGGGDVWCLAGMTAPVRVNVGGG